MVDHQEQTRVSNLIYPGDPGFAEILAYTPPPTPTPHEFFVGKGLQQILTPVDEREFIEYIFGGEYDAYCEELDD